jgi:UDP-3-O-[3-hydroxymyristoyl] glucosamine N-acyltransferase
VSHTLAEIAQHLDLEVSGPSEQVVTGLAALPEASGSQLSFCANKRYLDQLEVTSAGAVILRREWREHWSGPALLSDDPYYDFARATHLFDDRPQPSGTRHASAQVDPSAELDPSVTVDAGAVIGPNVRLAAGVWIGARVVVGSGCEVGEGTEIRPGVVLYHDVSVGRRCLIHANTTIGSDGFGFAPSAKGWHKILQLGRVHVGNHVEIGANCAIDRGALHDTVIGDGVIIDNHVHIAHGVRIGRDSAIAGAVAIAGSTVIGERCTIAGQAGLADHIEIADDVHIGGQGRVSRSISDPGHYASGTSIQPLKTWTRNVLRFEQLNELARRVSTLERQLKDDLAASDGECES